MKKQFLITTFLFIMLTASFSAENENRTQQNQNQNPNTSTVARGYRGVELGMDIDKVREVLKKDRLLEIDIRTDFGDMDEEPYHMIRARNVPYINSIYYQFGTTESVKKQLFAIIIHFNKDYNDFHYLMNKMKKKYGDPGLLTPTTANWENDKTKIILNAPSTVKYIDKQLYRTMQREYTYMRHRYFPPTDEPANNELTDDL